MFLTPEAEHAWLERFVGSWSYESEMVCAPGEEPIRTTGTEVVRSSGGLWIIAEGTATMPDGGSMESLMPVGYDTRVKSYVGTWQCSVMTHLWIYRGSVNAEGTTISLESEGPSFAGDGTVSRYKDVTEFTADGQRILTAWVQGTDGQWTSFMTARYRKS
ncbi:MAG: DUF1579 domain-containing protein [Planctomycetota bacterium]|nr:DUF1579 domain-containing protein [Planctomycetota bacterium]